MAWVESPLQLVGAAEWASRHARRVAVAGRLTPQLPRTADVLIERGARFGPCEAYLGIPWRLLARTPHWLIGDGFSGQFRLAVTVLRPRRITFLDDGDNAVAFADTLLGRRGYVRPAISERGLTTHLGPIAAQRLVGMGLAGRIDLFTAYDLGEERIEVLVERGVHHERHSFEWTRSAAPSSPAGTGRVLLGSALPSDGRVDAAGYLTWVAAEAAAGAVEYIPHRRESERMLRLVADIPGVQVVDHGLPVELVLAARGATEIITLPSSTATTLPLVLAGTGVRIRVVDIPCPIRPSSPTASGESSPRRETAATPQDGTVHRGGRAWSDG